ncbi:MAG: 2-oxoacid:acceptor oxidoreductase family protein [Spirochaetales bacterium]|nr:2-oxoacid:acceptor oxidoreductase family protein [Spirochaetales bacterium]
MSRKQKSEPKYPGIPAALDGNSAIIMCERESSDAAGAFPVTPSTQMGEYWAEAAAEGHINISGRPLIFFEPEGEHAAAGVTAGMSMSGLRASNFSSSQGIAYMHESLYAAAGKRLPYILNMGCRALTKSTLNVHAGHDDYHLVSDTGFIQVMAKNAQEAADLNLITRKIAELSLTPGIVAQDGFLTTHLLESMKVPERELIAEFLGRPEDMIETPTPGQQIMYGESRRRVPILWDVDNPVLAGPVQNQDSYMQSVAAQRPYFFDHVRELADQCMAEYAQLTGRTYRRVCPYRCEDAEYVLLGQGSMIGTAEAVADYLRSRRGVKVGVINLTMFRPFPGDRIGPLLQGRKGVAVLERIDQPLAEDLPLMCEIRSTIGKCIENGNSRDGLPYPGYAAYRKPQDAPPLYSGCYGLGSRDLQPEGLIGAVENMLPDGAHRKFYYLSVDFLHEVPFTPKHEIYQQEIREHYPHIKELGLRGSENPNLLPEGAITVRMHSVGGWGAMTTGKNLAVTLYELLGYNLRANPKYGSEKKGQPTTYYLSVAPEPIRINCEYEFVDVVLSPDPHVLSHSDPLLGLKEGGVFVIQSDLGSPEAVWGSIPAAKQKDMVDRGIRVFYLDAFKIAREEATDPELRLRMQGNAFQGAFFATSPLMSASRFTEETLFKAIQSQLEKKFGGRGAHIVEQNVRVVRRGFDEVTEIIEKPIDREREIQIRQTPPLPAMLKRMPVSADRRTDIHRFWEQTGSFYRGGRPNDTIADVFSAMSLMPASTGVFQDMTRTRFQHPEWVPENCTGCNKCFSVCPDSAIPGLVTGMADAFETTIQRVEKNGHETKHLRQAVRTAEQKIRASAQGADGKGADLRPLLDQAIKEVIDESPDGQREELAEEFSWFRDSMGDFKFALTAPYYHVKEKLQPGSGGLFSLTINPDACKGCMACVDVCEDNALRIVDQTPESVAAMRRDWEFWKDLPTTRPEDMRIDDIDEKIGALETLLLDKDAYRSMVGGDGACPGCGEKSILHLFTATVTALMQRRVRKHVTYVTELIERLEQHVRMELSAMVDIADAGRVRAAIERHGQGDLTLSELARELEGGAAGEPIDKQWLTWISGLLNKLKDLKWKYEVGTTGTGRAHLGFSNATGCSSVYGSTYPYNPYPFPWVNHLFQDAPSIGLGLFEGHMVKMAEGFKAIRMAEAELSGEERYDKIQESLSRFDWNQFSDEEYRLCPPVVAVGGDGAMYDIGFQNLSRALVSGRPIKVLILDTGVYSNTGGQACTSGFRGQISDMAPYGAAWKGKKEARKEISLIGAAHRSAYVLQGNLGNYTHMIEGFIDGLNARRPAMFNVYCVCQPEHGVPDDASFKRSKMALESRAYPVLRFDPGAGESWEQCLNLEGNPAIDADWPEYTLEYQDDYGNAQSMRMPLTFADFAFGEARFRKHFRAAPRDTWGENMVPIAEFIDLPEEDRERIYPYIWAVDRDNQLTRVIVSADIVASTEERREFWRTLKGLAGLTEKLDPEEIAKQVRAETAQKLTAGLMSMLSGGGPADSQQALANVPGPSQGALPAAAQGQAPAAAPGYEPVWIDRSLCTACGECMGINSRIFAYDQEKKAYVKDPKGGPYKDIVRAAEKCTGRCIHPGTPWDPNEKDLDKWVKRAQKFQ